MLGGFRRRVGVLTAVERTLKLLADGQQLDPGPHVRTYGLGHAEGPTPAADIPAVLPHGSEALLKEVNGLSHADLVYRCVVVVTPEVLHGLDLGAELFELDVVLLVVLLVLVLSVGNEDLVRLLPCWEEGDLAEE